MVKYQGLQRLRGGAGCNKRVEDQDRLGGDAVSNFPLELNNPGQGLFQLLAYLLGFQEKLNPLIAQIGNNQPSKAIFFL